MEESVSQKQENAHSKPALSAQSTASYGDDSIKEFSSISKSPSSLAELHTIILKFHQHVRRLKDETGRNITDQFKKLPLREEDPTYYELVQHPISFLMIRNRIDKHKYTSFLQWISDVELLLSNGRLLAARRPSVVNQAVVFSDIDAIQASSFVVIIYVGSLFIVEIFKFEH